MNENGLVGKGRFAKIKTRKPSRILHTHLNGMKFPLLSTGQVIFRFEGCWAIFFFNF